MRKCSEKMTVQYGFTLIELIIVIVLLSVLAVGSVQFISFSAQGYVDTARRGELASSASVMNEKISRKVRDALPGSVRINSDGSCLEFIPVIGATEYTQAPVVGNPEPQTEVRTVPIDGALSNSGYLAVYPVTGNVNDLYNNTRNPGRISSAVASVSASASGADIYTFSGGASFQFEQGSPTRRIFITSSPSAFCQQGNKVYFYKNYGFVGDISNLAAALPATVPNRVIISDAVQAGSLSFQYIPASLRRNALVSYEVNFIDVQDPSESLAVNQEVQIRNVP